jgi:AhpC/TSA family protein
MYEELKGHGFTVISVAEDKSADDARPWIEAAKPTHPSLIDTQHVVADLYNMVNVPTVVWIDEEGRIVRPNDVAFGNDMFKAIHGIEAEKHKALLRAWVRGEAPALPPNRARSLVRPPSEADQQARAEFALAFWLYEHERMDAAERHFLRAGELAPHDFMIRRGSMPIRGINSMGPEFVKMTQEWAAQGHPYYLPLEDAN